MLCNLHNVQIFLAPKQLNNCTLKLSNVGVHLTGRIANCVPK